MSEATAIAAARHPLRRAFPRQWVSWRARVHVSGEPDGQWQACTVTDISPGGVGLVLPGALAEEVVGASATIVVELNAAVRYTTTKGRRRGTRIGVEFDRLTEFGADIVRALKNLGGGW